MQTLLTSPASWIAMAAVGLVLGIAGPFGTEDSLRTVPRILYWLVVAVTGFMVGSVSVVFVSETLRGWGLGRWPAILSAGTLAGVAVFAVLATLNWIVFDITPANTGYAIGLAINAVAISVVISGALSAINEQISRRDAGASPVAAPAGPATPAPPRLLARLPVEKRGSLEALSVQDHYVEVITSKGADLVLMRLSDAIGETGDTPGLQVHRSHWVALAAVTSVRREGARAVLTLRSGRDIPVSRTYVPQLKEAGLLPG